MSIRFLLAAVKVVGISIGVTWAWLEWGRDAYSDLFMDLSLPIYGELGYTSLLPQAGRDRFINYLPFLILMLVTPRMSWLRRTLGIVVGFVVIFFFQVAFVLIDYLVLPHGAGKMTQDSYSKFLPIMLLTDSIPFVLWIIIAKDFVKEKMAFIFASVEAAAAPESKAPPEPEGEA